MLQVASDSSLGKKGVVLFGAAISLAALVFAMGWARSTCWGGEAVCPGIRVGGHALDRAADPDGWLGERALALSSRTVEVSVEGAPDARRAFTFAELGVVLDVARTASLVHAIGHVGSLSTRVAEARHASKGEIDVPFVVNVDDEVARAALTPLKDASDELPIPARLDLAHGGIIAEVPGRFLDLDVAIEQIRAAALSGSAAIDLTRVVFPPHVSRDFLEHVDSHERISRFQTSFSRHGDQGLRARNIETAAARLDGVVLLPGEVFSFNAAVGPRTVENGFEKGWEIFKGEMVEGIGGGTCQAASTFHAAAFLAGLDIVERLPHSRPSAYITMGLDATVVYPVVDLKVKNPYDFPIVVHSFVEGDTVVFELLGRERPARVTFGREIVATRPYTRKVEEKPGVPRDRIVRKQHGIRGYKIKRTRTIAYRDGTARSESNVDVYWPTIELFQVAPGTDPEGKLPPPGADLDESGTSRWSTPEEEAPASEAATTPEVATASATSGTTSPAAGEGAPLLKVVEAPGVHAPRAEQLHAPTKIIIGERGARPGRRD
jgi:vancomycin resistance protein YoaR